MPFKKITIREDIYKMLLLVKGTNERFNCLFERLVKSKSNVEKLKGLRGTVEFKNKDLMLKELSKKRVLRNI